VHRQLGELVAVTRGLQESVKRVEDQTLRSEDKSAERRAVVHRRMDEISTRVGSLESSLTSAKEDVTDDGYRCAWHDRRRRCRARRFIR
jgi:hypothetical protein